MADVEDDDDNNNRARRGGEWAYLEKLDGPLFRAAGRRRSDGSAWTRVL